MKIFFDVYEDFFKKRIIANFVEAHKNRIIIDKKIIMSVDNFCLWFGKSEIKSFEKIWFDKKPDELTRRIAKTESGKRDIIASHEYIICRVQK